MSYWILAPQDTSTVTGAPQDTSTVTGAAGSDVPAGTRGIDEYLAEIPPWLRFEEPSVPEQIPPRTVEGKYTA